VSRLPKIAGRIISKPFTERGIDGIVKWEIVPVADGERMRLVFEAVQSPWRQGVWLKCVGGIEIDGARYGSVTLWSDNSPPEIIFTCRTSEGRLHLYNIWDAGQGMHSQAHTSGMRVAQLDNGWRYQCNDIGFDAAFDKLVFRLERCVGA
jgi:hypothetical protein